jgi:hypothetical protein
MKRQERTSGFTVVEVLLVVIILCAIASLGWYVSKSLNGISATYSSATKTSNSTSPKFTKSATKNTSSNKAQQYFTISEWGVRAPYGGSLDLQYAMSDPGGDSALLSSSQLAAGGPDVCSAAGNSDAGILGRYLPTDSNLGPHLPVNETAEQYIEQTATVPHAKIGSYIYIYWGNNYLNNGTYLGPCNNKAAALQTINAFSVVVPKLQAIQ